MVKKIIKDHKLVLKIGHIIFLIVLFFAGGYYFYNNQLLISKIKHSLESENKLSAQAKQIQKELSLLKNEDQYKRNQSLNTEIENIQTTYKKAVASYENLLKLKDQSVKTDELDKIYAEVLNLLSQRNYASASSKLITLTTAIQKKQSERASSFTIPNNIPVNNSPPSSGYQRQTVQIDQALYLVDIITADLNSTKVVVDTASEADCSNDCPVMSLAEFTGRSGAFAGINGPYFCPSTYPNCADKKNTFDTLLMNQKKTYFNSANNVYSTVPTVIFSGNSARFVPRSLEWGRDTGVDAVIASQPLLVLNGEVTFNGDGETKRSSKGSRSFIGVTDSNVYIGVVHNTTVSECAQVLKKMGIRNALNLDSGGSTALWSGRYIVGPGRNTPFGIMLIRK